MSKLFRYSKSLGKSNGKKWSHIWVFFLKSGLKSPPWKKFITDIFFICSLCLNVFLPPLLEVQCPNILDFLGKSNGKKWSQIWNLVLIKGVKLPRKFLFFLFSANFALLAGFIWYWCYYLHWSRDPLSLVCGIFSSYSFDYFIHFGTGQQGLNID